MKRLYYLTPELDSAEEISKDIHRAGISDWRFHVIGKDEDGLFRRHIHRASVFEKLDIIRSGERGALIGLACAALATIWLLAAEPFGPQTSTFIYVSVFGFITLFGAWVGGLTGLSTENYAIQNYHDEIEAGHLLVMIDVRPEQDPPIRQLMAEKHPEARLVQVGSTLVTPLDHSGAHLA